MKKLLFILLLLSPFIGWSAGRFTIGSGSGTVSLTSMSGHSPGDTAAIIAGTYSFGDFENLTGIVFVPNTTQVTFAGSISIEIAHDSLCQFLGNTISGTTYGFKIIGSSTGFQLGGTCSYDRFWNLDFESVGGTCIDISTTFARYDTVNNNTMAMHHCTWGNITANNCGQLLQGTFASIDSLINIGDSIQFLNLSMTSIQGMGYAISWIGCFRLLVDGASFTGSMPGAFGDIGLIFIAGNSVLRNIRRNGGFGYIERIVTVSIHSTPISSYMYNVIDCNSIHYGTVDCRSGNSFGGESYVGQKSMVGGDFFISNVTSGNKQDTSHSYTTVVGVVGNMSPYGQFHMHNCFCYGSVQIQSGHNMTQINTADVLDTANNIYWNTALNNLQDSTTTWMPLALPLLTINSGGTNESAIYTTDINGVSWGATYGRGAVKYVATPSGNNNYLIFPRSVILKQAFNWYIHSKNIIKMRGIFKKYKEGDIIGSCIYLGEAGRNAQNQRLVTAQCSCGAIFVSSQSGLSNGHAKSCGCLQKKTVAALGNKNKTHGHSGYDKPVREYVSWHDMKSRCYHHKNKRYDRYGGRGIIVCDRWLNSYENFLEDMGRCPSDKHTLDRIENDKNYGPDNCRWAVKKVQANNTSTNVFHTFRGDRLTTTQLAEKYNIKPHTLGEYLKRNKSIDKAMAHYLPSTLIPHTFGFIG